MSRTGAEAKLPWSSVPETTRQQVAVALGAPIARAARIWGGYAPTPTFRLILADGRRAFMKGTFAESNEFSRHALAYAVLAQWVARRWSLPSAEWANRLLE